VIRPGYWLPAPVTRQPIPCRRGDRVLPGSLAVAAAWTLVIFD
jgi:hypothetical protein